MKQKKIAGGHGGGKKGLQNFDGEIRKMWSIILSEDKSQYINTKF
jgi:hypothetical protein